MELDVKAKLEQAQKNKDVFQAQLKALSDEYARVNILYQKWAGVCEYLGSL